MAGSRHGGGTGALARHFSRVFRLLDPAELARAFTAFMAGLRAELGLGRGKGVVAVDAKSLRRGYDKAFSLQAALMVSVWDTRPGLPSGKGVRPATAR